MKFKVFRILFLSCLIAALGFAINWWMDHGIGAIVVNVLSLPTQNARSVALRSTRESLDLVKEPNVYAFITQADLQYAMDLALKERARESKGDDPVVFSSVSVLVRPEGVGLTLPFNAQRLIKLLHFSGQAELDVAPSANGGNIDLVPMTARVRLDELQIGPWKFQGDERMTRAVASALNGVLTFATSRVASLSIPLSFGAARSIDLATLAPTLSITGAKRVNIRIGAEHVAVIPGEGGIHVLGRLIAISEGEFAGIVSALKALRARAIKDGPSSAKCTTCDFGAVGIGGYLACARKRAVCEARRQLGPSQNDDIRLTAPQSLVLSELKSDPAQKDLYDFFRPMLLPFGNLDENPPLEMTDLQYSLEVRSILDRLLLRRREVEDPALLVTTPASRFAVQRKFIAQAAATVLQPLRSSPFTVALNETREESLDRDIVSDPPPDLNCDKNAKTCEDFSFKSEPDMGCPGGSCATMNRHCLFGACVDVPGVDLNCQGRKLDCERRKGQEKIVWAAERAAAWSLWKVGHDACELTKTAQLAGCRLNQNWLNSWNGQKLGHLDGVARISGAKADFRLEAVTFADDLSSALIEGTFAGGAHVGATVVYKPADSLQGRLVCGANWGGNLNTDVDFRPQSIKFRASLTSAPAGGLIVRSDAQTLLVTMSPSPGLALLRDTPQMAVACPAVGLTLASPVGIGAAVVLAITDTFKVPLKATEQTVSSVVVEGTTRKVSFDLAPRTFIATLQ